MDLDTSLLGLALIVMLGLALAVAWLAASLTRARDEIRRLAEAPAVAMQLLQLQREVQAMRSGVDDRLREQLQQAQELSRRIGQLQEATDSLEQLGLGIGELQKILQPAQLRGSFGERLLEEMLADALPHEQFRLQYTYPHSGVRVDAAVFVGEGRVLPIDSKFPLDNFRRYVELRGRGDPQAEAAQRAFARDVRRHIDDVAARYLSPDDGAVDVAFMYIPSESVFHEVMVSGLEVNGELVAAYAGGKRVVPVSPSTLHAYLAVVRMGLRGYQLQRSAREVIASLAQLQADVQTLRSELDTAIRQANYSLANLREAEGALVHVEQRLAGIAMLGGEQHSGQIGGGAAER